MRRGFKAEAERHAASLRASIDCSDRESPNLAKIAVHLRVAVLPADQLLDGGIDDLLALHQAQAGAFSAATLSPPGKRRVVVYNPVNFEGRYLTPAEAKLDGRTRSNVAHEFSHMILGHEVRQVQKITEHYFFTCNPEQEEEANWLAGAILLPRPLLIDAARHGLTDAQTATMHNVTAEMARFRMNTSGAKMQVARARKSRSA
ncbi:ImmA/IrrE family metallo-endopeptidase [Pseudonocardia sp. GCM10023141]|uniref:ImmA/IrrE family metallo-endopeptidase n=1 Tax=Pseudonocardia sp. GCM10023141 TaxID=3252653 RepID=UPI00361D9941